MGRRQSRTGLDFARAVAVLGVARGVDSFVRHAIVERFGRDMLAVPVGRVRVRERSAVTVLSQLDPWLERVQRAQGSAAVVTALRRVEAAQYATATHGGARRLQEVLAAVADLERAVARSGAMRERVSPVSGLDAASWREALVGPGGSSAELRLALALASSADRHPPQGAWDGGAGRAASLATLLRPVQRDARRRLQWAPGSDAALGLSWWALTDVLAEALRQRAMLVGAGVDGDGSSGAGGRDGGGAPMRGPRIAFDLAVPASPGDVARLLEARVDEVTMGRLLAGLALLDWSAKGARSGQDGPGEPRWSGPALPAWAVLAPFFARHEPVLRPERGWVAQLCAGRVAPVISAGLRRLRIAGPELGRLRKAELSVAIPERDAEVVSHGVDGRRLAAALLVPMARGAYLALLDQVAPLERRPAQPGVERDDEPGEGSVLDGSDSESLHERVDGHEAIDQ